MYLKKRKHQVTFLSLLFTATITVSATVNALGVPQLMPLEAAYDDQAAMTSQKQKICAALLHEKHFSLPSLPTDMSRRQAGVAALGLALGARNITSPYPPHHTSLRAQKDTGLTKFVSSSNAQVDRASSKRSSPWHDYKRCINT